MWISKQGKFSFEPIQRHGFALTCCLCYVFRVRRGWPFDRPQEVLLSVRRHVLLGSQGSGVVWGPLPPVVGCERWARKRGQRQKLSFSLLLRFFPSPICSYDRFPPQANDADTNENHEYKLRVGWVVWSK